MTSLVLPEPFSSADLRKLFPPELELQQVQVLFRHGERTPIKARFQNAGLAKFWPYCSGAGHMMSTTLEAMESNASWSALQWKSRLETFGNDNAVVLATGPRGQTESMCKMGELTKTGRISTYKLGQRLRNLYVDRLKLIPEILEDANSVYLRATPIPRALESLQQVFQGMFPSKYRSANLQSVTINTRIAPEETLAPNEIHCQRLSQLSKAFSQRTAERWNDTADMKYLTQLFAKWMPEDGKKVAVDSQPRLSGIMDTINSTLAHGPDTKLPEKFYDTRARAIIEKIVVEEWFSGYKESQEYRELGIGGLMGDVLERMIDVVKTNQDGSTSNTNKAAKLTLSGCHDTTLAAILASLGAFKTSLWPPYTSHVAIELFKKHGSGPDPIQNPVAWRPTTGLFSRLMGTDESLRSKIHHPTDSDRSSFAEYYVRLRYNDETVTIPGCAQSGNHYDGDESLCTLDAFREIVSKFVPLSWQQACKANQNAPAFPAQIQPAGY